MHLRGAQHLAAPVAPVVDGVHGPLARHLLHVPEGRVQRVPVAGIAAEGQRPDDAPPGLGRGDRHLAAELVGLVPLALGDAAHTGLVQAVDFVLALALLPQHALEELHFVPVHPELPRGAQLPLQVAQCPPSDGRQPLAGLFRLGWLRKRSLSISALRSRA